MGFKCPVCKHPEVDKINFALMEGQGTMAVCKDFNVSVDSMNHHRASGHAARAMTEAVINVGRSGVLEPIHQFFIASKANRIGRLNEYLQRIDDALEESKNEKRPPDSKLLKVGVEILRVAAQELGEWRPDGGEKAEATLKLAQSIVIHAAVDAAKSIPVPKTIDVTPDKDE